MAQFEFVKHKSWNKTLLLICCLAFQSHTPHWNYAQRGNVPTARVLINTAVTIHGLDCYNNVKCMHQTNSKKTIAKLLTHPWSWQLYAITCVEYISWEIKSYYLFNIISVQMLPAYIFLKIQNEGTAPYLKTFACTKYKRWDKQF